MKRTLILTFVPTLSISDHQDGVQFLGRRPQHKLTFQVPASGQGIYSFSSAGSGALSFMAATIALFGMHPTST